MDLANLPPPEQRFDWHQWKPYPYPQFRSPVDPPPDALIWLLLMSNYEVARVHLQPGGSWRATVGTLWATEHQQTRLYRTEEVARARCWEWAQGRFLDLVASRPTAFRGAPIKAKDDSNGV